MPPHLVQARRRRSLHNPPSSVSGVYSAHLERRRVRIVQILRRSRLCVRHGYSCVEPMSGKCPCFLGASSFTICAQRCGLRPQYVENGKIHPYCGRRCAGTAKRLSINTSTDSAPQVVSMCKVRLVIRRNWHKSWKT